MNYVAERRRALIVEEVERTDAIAIRDLCERFSVTRETIRRDLEQLATQNRLRQVRGGAVKIEAVEASFEERTTINPTGKKAIANLACAQIPNGASVFLDSGSTVQAAVPLLMNRNGLVVYTNDITIALRLKTSAKEVHLLGGQIAVSDDTTFGLDTIRMISNYNTDYALIGVGGLSADRLFTDYDRDAAAARSEMISSAGTSILMADHTKFGRVAPVQLRNAEQATCVITDQWPDENTVRRLRQTGVDLTVADAID